MFRCSPRPAPSPCEIVKKVMRIPTWMKVDLPRLPLTQHIPKEQRRRRTQLAESKSGGGQAVSQSVSYFTVPPRAHPSTGSQSLRRSRSNTSTEYSLPGATQLSQVRSISPSRDRASKHLELQPGLSTARSNRRKLTQVLPHAHTRLRPGPRVLPLSVKTY